MKLIHIFILFGLTVSLIGCGEYAAAPRAGETKQLDAAVDSRPNEDSRAEVVRVVRQELDLGLCGQAARARYKSKHQAWCSEFVRYVFLEANAMSDRRGQLARIDSFDDLISFFESNERFLDSEAIVAFNLSLQEHIGNYLLLDTDSNGEPNHSAIIVGFSENGAYVHTIEGNSGDCVKGLRRAFIKNGRLDSRIKGIGLLW